MYLLLLAPCRLGICEAPSCSVMSPLWCWASAARPGHGAPVSCQDWSSAVKQHGLPTGSSPERSAWGGLCECQCTVESFHFLLVGKEGVLRHFFLFCFVFVFLGPHSQHMEVPRLGVELELQLLATPQPQCRGIPAASVTKLMTMPDPQPTE